MWCVADDDDDDDGDGDDKFVSLYSHFSHT